jgi:hypothetical protein
MLNDSRCDPRRADATLEAGEPDSDALRSHHQKALLLADQRRSRMLGSPRHRVKRGRCRVARRELIARDAVEDMAEDR